MVTNICSSCSGYPSLANEYPAGKLTPSPDPIKNRTNTTAHCNTAEGGVRIVNKLHQMTPVVVCVVVRGRNKGEERRREEKRGRAERGPDTEKKRSSEERREMKVRERERKREKEREREKEQNTTRTKN